MFSEFRKLIIPNIISNLSIPLVSLVDVGIMGHLSDSSYIIAIGLGVTVFNFLFWSFGFLRMSTTGLIANSFGKNNQFSLSLWSIRSFMLAVIIGLILLIFQDAIIHFSLLLIDTTPAISEQLGLYLKIRIWSAPATLLSYVYLGWFIGYQNSRWVLIFNLILNVSNVILSYVFVFHLNLNIEGVAYGSLIAQYLAVILMTPILLKRLNFSASVRLVFTNKTEWMLLFKMNGDIFLRTLCLIGVLSFLKVELAAEGSQIGAANVLLLEFVTIAAYFIDAIAYAAEATSGKYLGKGIELNFYNAKHMSFQLGFICALILSIMYFFFDDFILQQLTNQMNLVEYALDYSTYLIIFPLVAIWAFIWDGIFIGVAASSKMRDSMILASLVFILCYYPLDSYWGNHGKWIALLLFMSARGVVQFLQFEYKIKDRLSFDFVKT